MNIPVYNAFKPSDNSVDESNSIPYIKSLYSCLNRVKGDGYIGSFELISNGIQEIMTGRIYQPEELKIVNFFRFQGNSNPDDHVVMYIIEANDGIKGTYININSRPTLHPHKFENLLTAERKKVRNL